MAEPQPNLAEYSVSEISAALKRTVEDAFGYVRVRGEISGFRGQHSSGHCYFTLKDDKARLEAVIWRMSFAKLRFKPQEGLEVVATGKLTTFPGSSKYQIVIESLEPAGVGALMALLEERKRKFQAEGLFAEERKRPLPYLPRVIGVVTSPTGAVIRDILHRLSDRFPTRVLVWPVRVQGETSAAEVAAAIAGFSAIAPGGSLPRPDLVIVARGGGSLEDLWSFNEEIVVRAAAASAIPLISAIGHETDFTLLDFVADRRAPTPTAAAEIAVPVRSELIASSGDLAARLGGATLRGLESRRRELRAAARALPRAEDLFATARRSFDEQAARLVRALSANVFAHRAAWQKLAARFGAGRPERLIERSGERLRTLAGRQRIALAVHAERKRAAFSLVARRLRPEPVATRLDGCRRQVADLLARGGRAAERAVERRAHRLAALDQLLRSLSYASIVARGYAVIRDAAGTPLASAAAVVPGASLDIEFRDGHVPVIASGEPAKPPSAKRRRAAEPDQESLF